MPIPFKLDIKTFDYDDVMLVPERCEIASRSQVDVGVRLGNYRFRSPVVPANMSTIINEELATHLARNGYFYVMHRFDVDAVEFTRQMQEQGLYASISLGIKDEDYETVTQLKLQGLTPQFITVDIAHGWSPAVIKMVKYIKEYLPESFVIAGNIATYEAAIDLAKAGAGAVKVGIGPGAACLTSPNTGFGTRGWQLSAVNQVSKGLHDYTKSHATIVDNKHPYRDVVIIADGGIRHYGDIAKSIAFGADFVMIGGMLGGHDENPGAVIEDEDGNKFKEFFGSASEHQKGEKKHVEGRRMLVHYKGSIDDTLTTIKENLQSAVSYAGGKELLDLRDVRYVLLNNR